MNAHESFRIELSFHRAQSLSHHPARAAGVEMHVLIVRFDPIDLPRAQKSDSSFRPDDKSLQILRRPFEVFQERPDLQASVFLPAITNLLFGAFEGVFEARLI